MIRFKKFGQTKYKLENYNAISELPHLAWYSKFLLEIDTHISAYCPWGKLWKFPQ
jgi:hypothetical protein